jgi:hypothetical protein
MSVPPRLVAALRQQLARQPSGAGRVGWKYGSGESERIGDEIAVGSLTTATTLEEGGTYRGGGSALHADAEVAVELESQGKSPGTQRRSRSAISRGAARLRKSWDRTSSTAQLRSAASSRRCDRTSKRRSS